MRVVIAALSVFVLSSSAYADSDTEDYKTFRGDEYVCHLRLVACRGENKTKGHQWSSDKKCLAPMHLKYAADNEFACHTQQMYACTRPFIDPKHPKYQILQRYHMFSCEIIDSLQNDNDI